LAVLSQDVSRVGVIGVVVELRIGLVQALVEVTRLGGQTEVG
jgi:hypothetical protein